jgi:hypothetical protein
VKAALIALALVAAASLAFSPVPALAVQAAYVATGAATYSATTVAGASHECPEQAVVVDLVGGNGEWRLEVQIVDASPDAKRLAPWEPCSATLVPLGGSYAAKGAPASGFVARAKTACGGTIVVSTGPVSAHSSFYRAANTTCGNPHIPASEVVKGPLAFR